MIAITGAKTLLTYAERFCRGVKKMFNPGDALETKGRIEV